MMELVGLAFALQLAPVGSLLPGAGAWPEPRPQQAASLPPEPARAAAPAAPAAAPADRWLAEDKLKHFFMAYAVTSLSYGTARALGLEKGPSMIFGATAAGAASIGKELRDVRAGEHFSFKDLAWDAMGIVAGLALAARTR